MLSVAFLTLLVRGNKTCDVFPFRAEPNTSSRYVPPFGLTEGAAVGTTPSEVETKNI